MNDHDHLTALLGRLKLTVLRDQLDSLIDEAGRRGVGGIFFITNSKHQIVQFRHAIQK